MSHLFVIPRPDAFISGGNQYNLSLIRALRQLGEEVDHCEPGEGYAVEKGQTPWVDSLYLTDWCDQAGAPPANLIVHHLEGMYPEDSGFDPEKESSMLRSFDRFLCTSSLTATYLVSHGIDPSRCLVVEPACELPVPSERQYPDTLVALMVANLIPRKGILPFLQTLSQHLSATDQLYIGIAGSDYLDAGYAQACYKIANNDPRLKECVVWLGECNWREMTDHYLSHNLIVSASGFETYGMAIREAQTMGLPALVLKGGFTQHHIQPPRQGIVAQEMEDLVITLLSWARNPAIIQKMALKQWQQKPAPVSWRDQAIHFTQQTAKWNAPPLDSPSHEIFDAGWLAERAPFDEAARNRDLEQMAASCLIAQDSAVVMDLGCGSGNNISYLARQWPFVARWVGADHESSLLATMIQRFETTSVKVLARRGDLFQPETLACDPPPSVVVANAVFDLFTEAQMNRLLRWLQQNQFPILATLHYIGMAWENPLPDEEWVIGQYETHMKRQRKNGPGLGPDAPEVIRKLVQHLGGTVHTGAANWDIPASASRMQQYLLAFMEKSVPEILEHKQETERFDQWLDQKRQHLSLLTVRHEDMWITW